MMRLFDRCSSRQIFGGAKDFCPNFSKFARKTFEATLCENIFSSRPSFGTTSRKRFHMILQTLGAIFFKSNHVGRHFSPEFQRFCKGFHRLRPDFHVLCPDFWGFFPGFHQFKAFGGAVAPLPPAPLSCLVKYQWLRYTVGLVPLSYMSSNVGIACCASTECSWLIDLDSDVVKEADCALFRFYED